MPATALTHFIEDLTRARAIVEHAKILPEGTPPEKLLRDDLLRAAWMFGIGALDAYYCDAYADLLARTLRAKSLQSNVKLRDHIKNVKVPVDSVLTPYPISTNWRWRMAARQMMERENVLSLEAVANLFNPFFRDEHKMFQDKQLAVWMARADALCRVFGIAGRNLAVLTGSQRTAAIKSGRAKLLARFKDIIQRRHDCIHNCDRPKVAVQQIHSPGTVTNVLQDVEFLVKRSDEWIATEFKLYLQRMTCTGTTVSQVLAGF